MAVLVDSQPLAGDSVAAAAPAPAAEWHPPSCWRWLLPSFLHCCPNPTVNAGRAAVAPAAEERSAVVADDGASGDSWMAAAAAAAEDDEPDGRTAVAAAAWR